MPTLDERKLMKFVTSTVVAVPPGWLRYHGLTAGDTVEVIANGKVIIRAKKGHREEQAQGEAS
jgi:bifunctional DNA-binding transcriptional regulator/antitoxin component of YhaV-PrlF toxin-antitoxin module